MTSSFNAVSIAQNRDLKGSFPVNNFDKLHAYHPERGSMANTVLTNTDTKTNRASQQISVNLNSGTGKKSYLKPKKPNVDNPNQIDLQENRYGEDEYSDYPAINRLMQQGQLQFTRERLSSGKKTRSWKAKDLSRSAKKLKANRY